MIGSTGSGGGSGGVGSSHTSPGPDWQVVAADAGAAVLVLDHDGRVLHANQAGAHVYAKRSVREIVGLRLIDFMPPLAAQERVDCVRSVLSSGDKLVIRDLWSGSALRVTARRVESATAAGGSTTAPCVVWLAMSENALLEETAGIADVRMYETKHVDLGALSALTVSELKVLALIGEGLSNADIAARLHRAVKTVESHRASLTEKTGTASRVQLGVMARRAGLVQRLKIDSDISRDASRN